MCDNAYELLIVHGVDWTRSRHGRDSYSQLIIPLHGCRNNLPGGCRYSGTCISCRYSASTVYSISKKIRGHQRIIQFLTHSIDLVEQALRHLERLVVESENRAESFCRRNTKKDPLPAGKHSYIACAHMAWTFELDSHSAGDDCFSAGVNHSDSFIQFWHGDHLAKAGPVRDATFICLTSWLARPDMTRRVSGILAHRITEYCHTAKKCGLSPSRQQPLRPRSRLTHHHHNKNCVSGMWAWKTCLLLPTTFLCPVWWRAGSTFNHVEMSKRIGTNWTATQRCLLCVLHFCDECKHCTLYTIGTVLLLSQYGWYICTRWRKWVNIQQCTTTYSSTAHLNSSNETVRQYHVLSTELP